jgi:hypothetical protein
LPEPLKVLAATGPALPTWVEAGASKGPCRSGREDDLVTPPTGSMLTTTDAGLEFGPAGRKPWSLETVAAGMVWGRNKHTKQIQGE